MEQPAVKTEPPDDDANSQDATFTVKTEPADVDDVYSPEKETIVKVEIEIGPTVIRPPDILYKPQPCKSEPFENVAVGTTNLDANNVNKRAFNASGDSSKHEQLHSCVKCKRSFGRSSGLKNHMRSCIDGIHSGAKVPRKSDAQRAREYRARKKAQQQITEGTSDARRARDYRARKKALQLNNEGISDAQRAREYRARKKALQQNIEGGQSGAKPPRKSDAQRAREYKARKKARQKNTEESHIIQPGASQILPALQPINQMTNNLGQSSRRSHENKPTHSRLQADACDVWGESTQNFNHNARTQDDDNQSSEEDVFDEYYKQTIQHHDNRNLQSYTGYDRHFSAHRKFKKRFTNNQFGHVCSVCDRLWFRKDLTSATTAHENVLKTILPDCPLQNVKVCCTCKISLNKNRIPTLATHNGFRYPDIPPDLPKLDFISERFISPRLPFTQIRQLRHFKGQCDIRGQVINIPVSVDNIVKSLPRQLDDDYAINVHIKKQMIHKSGCTESFLKQSTIKAWLQKLQHSTLFKEYDIKINHELLRDTAEIERTQELLDEFTEEILLDDCLVAQQHTLVWNDSIYLATDPAENAQPFRLLFDTDAEELSFPAIYFGERRQFIGDQTVTPFMMAMSELRRANRRGVTPDHLLYMAMKIMRKRVRDAMSVAFKHIGHNCKITKDEIQSTEFVNQCLDNKLAFFKSIPNSVSYWSDKKEDLLALIRQLGRPTVFLTLSANEIGWPALLRLLRRLTENVCDLTDESLSDLSYMEKATLINEDAVTCVVYFSHLLNVLITILESKKNNPFGNNRVVNYFKRIEFPHCGSPQAHILLWLNNAPKDPLGENRRYATAMIDELISVSAAEASGNIELNIHKHTVACYKTEAKNKCIFGAPYMPCKETKILEPMKKIDPLYGYCRKRYDDIHKALEEVDYEDFDSFYSKNNITSDFEYDNILRAGINRPMPILRRHPSEKWHNPFNPFIFNVLQSKMDIQFITDDYSCAQYVVEYVNKANRGISDLQNKMNAIREENPDFNVLDLANKLGVDLLNNIEMSSQEAAWYLLREPMSCSSVAVVYIPTNMPEERHRIRKTTKELEALAGDSTDIWKQNVFDTYQKRDPGLENVTLAQFASKYYKNTKGVWDVRKVPKVIRYRNYDITKQHMDYRRELVTLHMPFRHEYNEILHEDRYYNIYQEQKGELLRRQNEFQADIEIEKTVEICQRLCREAENEDEQDSLDCVD